MKKATLKRFYKDARGVLGNFTCEDFKAYSVEPPDLNNEVGKSCIPEGTYICRLGPSSKNKPHLDEAFEVLDVVDRTQIKIHIANYPRELEGCIALGSTGIKNNTTLMVTNSASTIKKFHDFMGSEDFELTITS